MIALGTLIALLPETVFAFAVARVPAPASATGALLLPLLLLAPGALQAQDIRPPEQTTAQAALQRQLESELICMCGNSGCVRATLVNCPMRPACHGHTEERMRIRQLIDEGKTHDEIVAIFVQEHGQAVLAVPEDRGFNRLAWALPYLLAGAGLITIIVNARRWSHRPEAARTESATTNDPVLDARLDNELRDLD
jgi:cytochrome c-type biogenesis protein CcmH/NrfF